MTTPGPGDLSSHFSTLIDSRAVLDPHGAAIGQGDVLLSNAALHDRVLAASAYLVRHGLQHGDIIALRLPNCVEFVTLMFAAWRIGCTVTPVNPALVGEEVDFQLADSGSKVVIDLEGTTRSANAITLAAGEIPVDGGDRAAEPVADGGELALLIYTSGTTGRPKGVMLTHDNIMAMASMGTECLDISSADRCLLILPLFHVNGIVVSVLTPMLRGGSTVIAGRFDPLTFFDLVAKVRPTYFSGVPTIYAMLAQLPDFCRPGSESLRFGLCGAAPAPAGLLESVEQRFGFPVVEGYGLSEATCATTINPYKGRRKAGTVGLPMPRQRVRIVGADGAPVEAGEVGEVTISGANVMRGYLGRPDETRRAVVDGWLFTGDLGHLDEDGYLVLDGRSKDMIIRGGENIYPREIEDVIAADPRVVNVAVVGIPDATWGEVVVAFVTLVSGVDRHGAVDELDLHCAAHLSPYKRPVAIRALDDLPVSPMGKIDKLELRARAAGHVADQMEGLFEPMEGARQGMTS